MSNMSYCRFRNTLKDLQDCYDHLWNQIDDDEEARARDWLIELCQQIVDEGFEDHIDRALTAKQS